MSTAIVKSKGETFRRYVESREQYSAAILPAHLSAQRMTSLILAAANQTPKILNCSQSSIATAIKVLSELGLEPGSALGLAYLIPYGKDLQVIIGYKGLCALALRSGAVKSIAADVVYQTEIDARLFSFKRNPVEIFHAGDLTVDRTDPDRLVACWARVELMTGGAVQIVMTQSDVHKRRAKSVAFTRKTSPWQTDTAAMWRKTALRALIGGGTVPMSAAMSRAFDLEPAHVENEIAHDAAAMGENQAQIADSDAHDQGYEDPT